MLIERSLVHDSDGVFRTPRVFHAINLILAPVVYSIQIYFDFSGYSDTTAREIITGIVTWQDGIIQLYEIKLKLFRKIINNLALKDEVVVLDYRLYHGSWLHRRESIHLFPVLIQK
jgi:hypothetical protein